MLSDYLVYVSLFKHIALGEKRHVTQLVVEKKMLNYELASESRKSADCEQACGK